jgi:hypothetical protein
MNYPLLEGIGNLLSRKTAELLDQADELSSFRKEFFIKDEYLSLSDYYTTDHEDAIATACSHLNKEAR